MRSWSNRGVTLDGIAPEDVVPRGVSSMGLVPEGVPPLEVASSNESSIPCHSSAEGSESLVVRGQEETSPGMRRRRGLEGEDWKARTGSGGD